MAVPARLFNQCQLGENTPSSRHENLAARQFRLPGVDSWNTPASVALRTGRGRQDRSKMSRSVYQFYTTSVSSQPFHRVSPTDPSGQVRITI
ncbi:hypothetical protein FOWG_18118 [Fusarium oxysporum f. sp. lycopersici MN25]|nr:hypothetical protein FOWG_18118 [Fusarium oxysporum f. sp. lycopersici MN25]